MESRNVSILVESGGQDRMKRLGYSPTEECFADKITGKTLIRYIIPKGMMLSIMQVLTHDGIGVVHVSTT